MELTTEGRDGFEHQQRDEGRPDLEEEKVNR